MQHFPIFFKHILFYWNCVAPIIDLALSTLFPFLNCCDLSLDRNHNKSFYIGIWNVIKMNGPAEWHDLGKEMFWSTSCSGALRMKVTSNLLLQHYKWEIRGVRVEGGEWCNQSASIRILACCIRRTGRIGTAVCLVFWTFVGRLVKLSENILSPEGWNTNQQGIAEDLMENQGQRLETLRSY